MQLPVIKFDLICVTAPHPHAPFQAAAPVPLTPAERAAAALRSKRQAVLQSRISPTMPLMPPSEKYEAEMLGVGSLLFSLVTDVNSLPFAIGYCYLYPGASTCSLNTCVWLLTRICRESRLTTLHTRWSLYMVWYMQGMQIGVPLPSISAGAEQ